MIFFYQHKLLVIRQKGLCISRGKKCSFFGKIGMPCFLETPVLRFALLLYCQQNQVIILFNWQSSSEYLYVCTKTLYFWQLVLIKKRQKAQIPNFYTKKHMILNFNWSGPNSQEIVNFVPIMGPLGPELNWCKN